MNKRGESVDGIIKAVFGLLIIIPMLIAFITTMNQITSQFQNSEVQKVTAEKDQQIQNIQSDKDKYQAEADFYKTKYENLVNNSVTKEDIVSIQGDLQVLKSQVGGLQNKTDITNQNIFNLYNIHNTYYYLTISLVINFTLLSLAVFDWAFLNFSMSEWSIRNLRKVLDKIKNMIKNLFKKESS
jgi:hypothetical protein